VRVGRMSSYSADDEQEISYATSYDEQQRFLLLL